MMSGKNKIIAYTVKKKKSYVNGSILFATMWDWLFSLSTTSLGSSKLASVSVVCSLLLLVVFHCMDAAQFNHSSAEGQPGCFQCVAIMKKLL